MPDVAVKSEAPQFTEMESLSQVSCDKNGRMKYERNQTYFSGRVTVGHARGSRRPARPVDSKRGLRVDSNYEYRINALMTKGSTRQLE